MSKPGGFSSSDLTDVARSLGYAELPELVDSLSVAVERGHHLAVLAGEGSGAALLFGLAVALRCESKRPEVQALVVTGTRERAVHDAVAIHSVAGSSGVKTHVWEEATEDLPHAVCGRAADLLVGIRSGRLRLGGLRLLVLDGLQDFDASSAWPAAESILDTLEPETQRIACTSVDDATFRSLIDRRLPRARTWPPELFPPAGGEGETRGRKPSRAVWTVTGEDEAERVNRLVTVLRQPPDGNRLDTVVVRCATEAEAGQVRDLLSVRGVPQAGEPGAAGVFVGWGTPLGDREALAGRPDLAVLFGLPSHLATFREWLEDAGSALVCVAPRDIPQLSIMVRRLSWTWRELGWPLPAEAGDAIDDYRTRIRKRAEEVDEIVQLSLLAALSDLVRRQETGAPPATTASEAAVRPAWTPIFLNVGQKDGAGPGDIVGAITGETPAVAAQIGKIDVRATHTIVELDSLVADEVIAALQGSRIKGRSVSARPDRGGRRTTSARTRAKSRGRGG